MEIERGDRKRDTVVERCLANHLDVDMEGKEKKGKF